MYTYTCACMYKCAHTHMHRHTSYMHKQEWWIKMHLFFKRKGNSGDKVNSWHHQNLRGMGPRVTCQIIRRNYINNYSFEYRSLTGLTILFHGPFFLFCYLCVQDAGEERVGVFLSVWAETLLCGWYLCLHHTRDLQLGNVWGRFCLLIDIKVELAKPSSSLRELPPPTRPLPH